MRCALAYTHTYRRRKGERSRSGVNKRVFWIPAYLLQTLSSSFFLPPLHGCEGEKVWLARLVALYPCTIPCMHFPSPTEWQPTLKTLCSVAICAQAPALNKVSLKGKVIITHFWCSAWSGVLCHILSHIGRLCVCCVCACCVCFVCVLCAFCVRFVCIVCVVWGVVVIAGIIREWYESTCFLMWD